MGYLDLVESHLPEENSFHVEVLAAVLDRVEERVLGPLDGSLGQHVGPERAQHFVGDEAHTVLIDSLSGVFVVT